ncbi:intracellular hyaluronan-binding protein 4 isoform X1 [Phalacrocorax aristotelis]|uniref:intracellular hyaluronan-binding protein 4 isoform X1 n=1 Tax=Phalacrocorax aristotelis TaxID=126867 RepID=UPI003F4B1959
MKKSVAGSVAGVMQEDFGCTITNRFSQLLDDDSDPFDVVREAECRRRQQQQEQRQKRSEAGRRAAGRRESQRERRQSGSPSVPGWQLQSGKKQAPTKGEQQGSNNKGAEVKEDKTEWRPSSRQYRSSETGRQAEITMERNKNLARDYGPTERLDYERPIRGRGSGRDRMQGRGRGGELNRSVDGSDEKEKWELQRHSRNGNTGMEQNAPMEETAATAEKPGLCEGEPRNKVAEGQPMEELVQEMTLDEWKNLQQQNRPKPGFNIRKPESTVPSKAVVIHRSKYRDDLQKTCEDSHVFRRPANDITSQLHINFGSLPRPGCGSRGARGGRGCGRQVEETGSQRQVVQLVAPNPDDPEDFPALA